MPKQTQTPDNDWSTDHSSGLPDKITLTVGESYYSKDPRYNEGKTLCLIWRGPCQDEDENDIDLSENPILISCGDKWDSNDGGKTAEHDDGKTKFNSQSHMGMLIDRCVEDLGMGKVLATRGAQTDAEVWEGLSFYLEREEVNYGGKIGTVMKLLPIKFLGEEGEEQAKGKRPAAPSKSKSAAGKTSTPAKSESKSKGGDTAADKIAAAKAKVAAKKKAAEPEEAAEGEETLEASVRELARDSEDYASFVDAAQELEGVVDDEELLAAVLDEDGIWSEEHSE